MFLLHATVVREMLTESGWHWNMWLLSSACMVRLKPLEVWLQRQTRVLLHRAPKGVTLSRRCYLQTG